MRSLEEISTALLHADKPDSDAQRVREALRPKELDYVCTIAAILWAHGVCSYEDLPDLDQFDLEDDD